MQFDREALAWAAGFFDGEGYVACVPRARGWRLVLRVDQAQPGPLYRFQEAVGGLGRVNGPYRRSNPAHKPKWNYSVEGHQAQAVAAMLWGFVSGKREQMQEALRGWKEKGRSPGRPSFRPGRHGHYAV